MKGKLKALGLALLAAFAVSAVVAQAAHATAKITTVNGDYPAVLTGEQEKALDPHQTITTNYFEGTPGNKIHCPEAKYEGTITGPATTVTITPHFGPTSNVCEATSPGLNVGMTIHLNGCHFIFEALAYTAVPNDVHARVKIVCPVGQKITLTAATCTVHVFPQTLGGAAGEVTLTNKPAGAGTPHPYITADIDLTNKIHYEDTDGFLCPFNGNTTGVNGSFVSEVIIKGYEDSGNSPDPVTTGLLDYTHPQTETAIHVK